MKYVIYLCRVPDPVYNELGTLAGMKVKELWVQLRVRKVFVSYLFHSQNIPTPNYSLVLCN